MSAFYFISTVYVVIDLFFMLFLASCCRDMDHWFLNFSLNLREHKYLIWALKFYPSIALIDLNNLICAVVITIVQNIFDVFLWHILYLEIRMYFWFRIVLFCWYVNYYYFMFRVLSLWCILWYTETYFMTGIYSVLVQVPCVLEENVNF